MENNQLKISFDVQYQNLFQEMRRYRNAISAVGCWYSTLLIALAFVSRLVVYSLTPFEKSFLCFLLGISAVGVCYILWFDTVRYFELRDTIKNSKIEPLDRFRDAKILPIKPTLVFTILIVGFTFFIVMQLLK